MARNATRVDATSDEAAAVRNYALMSGEERRVARQNAALTEEEFEQVDQTVQRVAEERIPLLRAARDAGLTRQVDGLGVLLSTYRAQSDMSAAERSMTGRAVGEGDRPEVDTRSVPVPMTFKDFDFDLRLLESSRRMGESFDDSTVRIATRKVAESLEDLYLNGDSSVQVNGNDIPGLTTFSDRNTISRGTGSSWDDLSDSNLTQILTDVLDSIQKCNDVNFFGPFWLVLPGQFTQTLEKDFKAESDRSVRNRLEQIDSLRDIIISDQLADDNVLVYQATSDVTDVVVGEDVDVFVDEEDRREMLVEGRVFAALVPRLKSTFNNNAGITHLTLQT